MQLFYNPEINEDTNQFSFNREESKHIIKVLRKTKGDYLHITNGRGWLFQAEIEVNDIKKCVVNIISKSKQPKRNYSLHLALVLVN
jgi:16S rRNA (uracil1498-N3)-methyltransferase